MISVEMTEMNKKCRNFKINYRIIFKQKNVLRKFINHIIILVMLHFVVENILKIKSLQLLIKD